jgi:pyrimidine operon attenuation protein/uracil phosphoribosyltransferase
LVRKIKLPLKDDISQQMLEQLDNLDIKNSYPIVVDDVIFSGKTMFSALKLVTDHKSVSEIHTAVLIDRGHRKFPIRAEFCGMELPTKLDEHVSVMVDGDNVEKVVLTSRQN